LLARKKETSSPSLMRFTGGTKLQPTVGSSAPSVGAVGVCDAMVVIVVVL
jgi:hypothetical protein